ncbi:collagen alpha-1(XII) chain-like isoform X2 [Pecten maximus]|uniref:collagen alpha-1(XII) chain-like isoform X2 n=1 Tax=Pecten maximus TaxID=6579 RepID=UPI0014587C93|nr:collagen alpha-1(XII) chain-like isoform X2 [Pecten maximus]
MASYLQSTFSVFLLGFYIPLLVAQGIPDCRGQKADIIFLLDSSTSEGQPNFNHQLDFVKNLTKIYDIGPNNVQIGLTTFSTQSHHQFWLNSYQDQTSLQNAIGNVPYMSGNTNTGDGLNFVTTQGFSSAHGMRNDATHILVVITDGQSQDTTTTAAMAAKVHQAGIEVVAIGIGNGVRMSELQAIASDSKHVLTVESFLALASIQHNLASTTCSSCKTSQADVVFILDSSGSEGNTNFQKELQFVSNFVTNVHIGPQNIQVGLVTFSDIAQNEFYMNTYQTKRDMIAKLQNVSYRGSTTHTELGLQYARQDQFTSSHGSRPNVKKIAVVLTDGQSHSHTLTLSEATKLKQFGVTIISVGIGTAVSETEINGIASDLNHVFTVATFDALHTIQSELENTACGGTVPPPTTVSTECGSKPADIVFVLDSSGSEGADNFNKQLQFMTNFVTNFQIGPHDVQFGLVTFSIDAINEFYLNTYNNQQDISNKLTNIAYVGSTTHTELGLQYARQFQFTPTHGSRHNAQKIVIILTDGQSNSKPDTIHEANLLKQMGVKIISIGIGTGISQTELESMATDQQHVFNVGNFDALHTIQSELKNTACGVGSGGTAVTSPGPNSVCMADVVFAIDASGNEGQSNFQKSLSFMSEVVNEFPVSPGNVQFSLVTFGAHASLDFKLSQYHNKASLIRAIQRAPYIGGSQTSWVALHLVRQSVLTAAGGARAGVKSFVILITNGPSSSHSAFLRETATLNQSTNMTGIAIGIGNGVNSYELDVFAADRRHEFRISNADDLSTLKHTIRDTICGGTAQTLTTSNPALATTPTDSFQVYPDSSN